MRIFLLAVLIAVATLIYPQWIEALTGADPDAGSGAIEAALIVVCLLVAAVRALMLAGPRALVRRAPRR